MLIKKAYMGEFRHFLSILRLAVLDNRLFITFPKKKFNYLAILKQLQNQGFIESCEERGELIVVSLKQTY
jgi:ribosomal protein S8